MSDLRKRIVQALIPAVIDGDIDSEEAAGRIADAILDTLGLEQAGVRIEDDPHIRVVPVYTLREDTAGGTP